MSYDNLHYTQLNFLQVLSRQRVAYLVLTSVAINVIHQTLTNRRLNQDIQYFYYYYYLDVDKSTGRRLTDHTQIPVSNIISFFGCASNC